MRADPNEPATFLLPQSLGDLLNLIPIMAALGSPTDTNNIPRVAISRSKAIKQNETPDMK